jgi:hypothetical protein
MTYAQIQPIAQGDKDGRDRVNRAFIDLATLSGRIDAEEAARLAGDRAAPIASPLDHRPGDAALNFTLGLGVGEAGLAPLDPALIATSAFGAVARIAGAGVVASRWLFAVEPGRTYAAIFALRRHADAPDPSNDAVRCGLDWLDAFKARINVQTQVWQDLDLTVADGRVVQRAVIARAAASGVDHVAPVNGVYVRPYVEAWGGSGQTDVEVIAWLDITDAGAAPNVSALSDRVTNLESLGAGARLTALEAGADTGARWTIETSAGIPAATIPGAVQVLLTLGHDAPGDGFGGWWKKVGASGQGARQSLDGAWWRFIVERGRALPAQCLGAKGTNLDADAAAETAAFAALEALAHGRDVDLGGKVYRVTAIPRRARYFNGGFRDATRTLMRRMRLPATPLDGAARCALTEAGTHLWNGPIGWDPVRKRWFMFFTRSPRHGNSPGGKLHFAWSYDCFQTVAGETTVATIQGVEANANFAAGGMMSAGRIGIVSLQRTAANVYSWQFIYSDTGGAPFTIVDIGGYVTHPFVPLGQMLADPVGGADAYMVFGGGTGDTSNDLRSLGTTDNGATWTSRLCVAGPGGTAAVEWNVAEVVAGGYMAIARDDTASTTVSKNALATTSVNLRDWTPVVDAGIDLGAQPPCLFPEDGIAHVATPARGGFLGFPGYGTPIGHENRLLLASQNAREVFDAGGVFTTGAWVDLGALPHRATGGFYYTRDPQGVLVFSFNAGERLTINADPEAEQSIYILTTGITITAQAKPRRVKLSDNRHFRRRWHTAKAAASNEVIADRWRWAGAAPANVQFPVLSDELAVNLPHRSASALAIASDGAAFSSLEQIVWGRDAVVALANTPIAMTLIGSGVRPPQTIFQVEVYADGANLGPYTSASLPAAAWLNGLEELRAVAPPMNVPRAALAENAFAKVSIKNGEDAVRPWAFSAYYLDWEPGPDWSDPEFIAPDREADILDRYSQLRVIGANSMIGVGYCPGDGVGVVALPYSKMIVQPISAALRAPLAGDFAFRGTLCDAGTTVDYFDQDSLRLRLTGLSSPAITAGMAGDVNAQRLREIEILTGM